ncbi:MAG: carbohydrate-binding family 9-like protein [Chitinophagaceae bacterium]|nr:carbohydrate-binding family 9-like protein [Chitinophagaceae bacterium]
MKIRLFVALITLFPVSNSLRAQDIFSGYEHLFTPPLHYVAYYVQDTPQIDGRISESAWALVPWSAEFVDIEGESKPLPRYSTRFKLLWDSSYLYLAALMEEPHISATLTQHDQIVYNDNDFEVFIDPDNDNYNYFEIEVNALNTLFDLFLSKPYRDGGPISIEWDVEGIQSAVYIDGTLNDPTDTDRKWIVEMAIPVKALQKDKIVSQIIPGSFWRINFSRVQWEAEVGDGVYKKKINPSTGRPYPEHNWVWSPQGVVNMHYPERWGYLWFASFPTQRKEFVLPPAEELKSYLWLIYYKQKEFYQTNRSYAEYLSLIEMPSQIVTKDNGRCELTMVGKGRGFEAGIVCDEKTEYWQIDQHGKLLKMQ